MHKFYVPIRSKKMKPHKEYIRDFVALHYTIFNLPSFIN